MARLRPLLLRAIAVACGLLLALVAVEVALRISGWPPPPLESGRLETRHRSPPSRPDFRDRGDPLAAEKPQGTRRIVVVGDSFTWGAGVLSQHAYPDVMGEALERRAHQGPGPAGSAIEVVNFSRPGWNTVQELTALGREWDRLEPDVLVLGYCLNDAEPHRRRELQRLRRDVHPREPEGAPARFLAAHSALFRLAFRRADNVRMRRATAVYYHHFYAGGQPSWEAAQDALGGMHDLATSHGVPFLVAVFPIFDSQLDHRYRYHALHQTMARTGAELGIEVLDLLPFYVGIDARRLALDPFADAHPSELGHRIAATAILDELERRAWLGSSVAADSVPLDAGGQAGPIPSEQD